MSGILARKIGMTRCIRAEDGKMIPVTILHAPQAKIIQRKTLAKDGYEAIVVGAFPRRNKGKNITQSYYAMREFAVTDDSDTKSGGTVDIKNLSAGNKVEISAIAKGKGFAGVIKRHNFHRGPETHGSHHHREPGSIGMCAKPARVLKGKKMPGRMGGQKVTRRSAQIVEIDTAKDLLAISGAVPGSINSFVSIVL